MVIILLTGGRIWDDLFAFFSYFLDPQGISHHSLMPHTNILVILGRNIKEIIISLALLVLSGHTDFLKKQIHSQKKKNWKIPDKPKERNLNGTITPLPRG